MSLRAKRSNRSLSKEAFISGRSVGGFLYFLFAGTHLKLITTIFKLTHYRKISLCHQLFDF